MVENHTVARRALHYTISILSILALVFLKIYLPFFGGPAPYLLFAPVLTLISYFLGVGPGIVAMILSGLFVELYFIDSGGHPFLSIQSILRSVLFFSAATGVILLINMNKRERALLFKSESELRENRDILNSIVANAPSVIFLKDTEGKYILMNQATLDRLGLTPEDFIGKTDLEIFKDNPEQALHLKENDLRVALEKRSIRFEEKVPSETGEIRTYLCVKFPILNERGDVEAIGGVGIDISKIKDQQELLHSTVLELEDERRVREHFVATLSHDLRSPLAAGKMSTELAYRTSEISQKNEKYFKSAIANIDRINLMIQNLLDANLIRAGKKLSLDIEEFDLKPLSKSVIENLGLVYGERFQLKAEGNLFGYWSREGVQRCLENLITNAIKYGSADDVVSVEIKACDDSVCISVHNVGNPIPGDEIGSLFKPYYRLKKDEHKKGWGLGLSLVTGISEALGGTVIVESSAKSGTTFTIKLPWDSRKINLS